MGTTLTPADEPIRSPASQMSKLMDQLAGKGYYGFYPNDVWNPSVNLYETDAAYHVCVDLAGVDKKKIDIEVHNQRLTIKGHRPVPTCAETGGADFQSKRVRVHLMEIDHGSFSREVELPEDVVQENIVAKYVNGMLWIELPKKS